MPSVVKETLELEDIAVTGYEKVVRVRDPSVGLDGIICIHSTALGPSLGGTRVYPYPNFEAALTDAMRLSEAMTHKSSLSESGWGGAKAVINADPKKQKTEELLRSYARAVDRLEGKYICAEDVGTTPEDMSIISKETRYVVGLPHEKSSGNPSPFTAWGTLCAIESTLQQLYGDDSLEGKTVAIQGLGSVGSVLAEHLFWAGAKLIVTDIDTEKCAEMAKKFGATIVAPDEIFNVACDIFAPCAMGGILNSTTIPKLRCAAVAGSANNQLLTPEHANDLKARKILYAPDYIANCGGLLNVTQELDIAGYNPVAVRNKIRTLRNQLMVVYDIAEQKNCSTHRAAMELSNYRLTYGIGKRTAPPRFHHAN